MLAELYRNIDLVQIPIQSGIDEYYFPKNVDWANKVIDKIVLCTPTNPCVSPIDGTTPVLTRSQIADMYIDLYASDDSEITHNLSYEQLLYTNNHPVIIGKQLNLNLSRIYMPTAPSANSVLLMYVFYGTNKREDYEPSQKSVTLHFPMAAGERMTFQDIINTYVHADGKKIRGIQIWDAENNPAYLTLRDYELTYIIKDVHTAMFRPQMAAATVESTQIDPIRLDSLDINFDYSFVQNATNSACTQIITLEY